MTTLADNAALRSSLIAVIPARGGSKRIPRKNLRRLGGRPIIDYTIRAALDSGLFAHVIVTTDDREIADTALRLGAEVPFLREPNLADDFAPVSLATLDVLQRVDAGSDHIRVVAQLMPNCPLRTAQDIVASYATFIAEGHAAQISVCEYGWFNPWWALEQDSEGCLNGVFPERLVQRSQDLPRLLCPSGAVWWASAHVLKTERTFHVRDRGAFVMPWEHAIDIDDESDWRMAEWLIEAGAGFSNG